MNAPSHGPQLSDAEFAELTRRQFESSPIGIAIVGLDGAWLAVNPKLCDIVGYSADELLAIDFQTITHPDDLESDLDHVNALLRGEADSYQMNKRYIHKDGSIVWIRLSVGIVREQDQPKLFISDIEDISELVAAQKEKDEQAAELAASNAELEQFAYVASHDLRAPLRTVKAFSELLADSLTERQVLTTEDQELLGHMLSGVSLMSEQISALLMYSRIDQAPPPTQHTLLADVTDALAITRADVDANQAEVSVVVPAHILITVDSGLFRSAVANLISNSVKYAHPDRKPAISISAEDTSELVRLQVSDNGIGINPDRLQEAFLMFRRLNTQGSGVGIGLASVKRIVERFHGRVVAESDGHSGATITISLPAVT